MLLSVIFGEQSFPGNSKIREFYKGRRCPPLEELLLAGYGPSLLNQPSTDRTVRNFLKTVPAYMIFL
ncbi:hypothetical protein Avbf_10397 [Armadillidium vulgare]|nr:hypothetical protein Avbf_10397 [Armadillidium vulgare]